MYQLPVENIEKIRKSRRKVKNILSELGLEDCQKLLKDLREKSEDNLEDEEAFENTEWEDFMEEDTYTKKKWPYRSQILCCALCKYSTKNIFTFKGHVSRCHDYEYSACALEACSDCHYVGHARALRKHVRFFHTSPSSLSSPNTATREWPQSSQKEKYLCRRCGYPSSSLTAIKKHVILRHLESLAQQFIGYKMQPYGKIYICKICKLNMGTLDQMLHHMLTEPVHTWVNSQVQKLISENKSSIQPPNGTGMYLTFPNIAPKTQTLSNRPVLVPNIGQHGQRVVALQQVHGTANGTTLIRTPGTNQSYLSPQASALVQLARAETKDLLPPGTSVALQGSTSASVQQAPLSLAPAQVQSLQNLQAHQMLLPKSHLTGTVGVAQKESKDQTTPQGTMMTSQSLLTHLIPTGNRINGLPTYTFAPPSMNTPLKPVVSANNSPQQTKKWITCPHCNELFPSNVYEMHMEIAHRTKSITANCESVAVRAPFLKKMPDKTVKCLMCKILLSEQGVIQHLLHGLNCLYCSALFFSLTQLIDHLKEQHPKTTANCDLLRREYRVYTDRSGQIMFPYFDITTTAPKDLLGDMEINLVLVTSALDLIFLKMLPSSTHPDICQASVKISSACCPFCYEKFQNPAKHLQHLKQKHFVAPTVHAILKTEAFKCVYCNGVYTGKLTQQAVMLHLQRCRSSPKRVPEPLRISAGNQVPAGGMAMLQPVPTQNELPKLFLQIPQQIHMKQVQAFTPAKPQAPLTPAPTVDTPETSEEQLSTRRLEEAWRQVVETNQREREQMAEKCKRRREEKMAARMLPPSASSGVKLLLEPTVLEVQVPWERKQFIFRYFNVNPYITKGESEELCKRLNLNKSELGAYFGNRRTRCLKSLKRTTAKVLLGFKMTELRKVKHNLLIPKSHPVNPVEKLIEMGPRTRPRTSGPGTDMDRSDAGLPSQKKAESNLTHETKAAVTGEVEEMET
ncbi:antizyme inhibitor 1b isoform X1 [Gadus chalcogrammus]|uniref:antizyme inhibitor 1b isoform X1 n=1 Tax=Gadus chalcogrammus TaxID=1042646 RepID=UPI0024C4B6B9|nr:antizyme inhibitor 1b isoform X1 [Gadus chalcogrammus]XP_056438878.1 antizyme inhibitor 1b isoform X1 [Gadus chalcogrammus]XP_056438879.1 antizyme inhibitor 1b isoform X1 [Gadus chalcogrammus]XP_056438880.1 antizyme inhibitor 1b isoform X1 [Gadus chalcogrammus]XP_056438881.1 antizyme inhibitor 1b isoform X1 [Gadus chalcogrammus]XP_056438883.1 antizyme inhibitor 1b isoform X1 [Gadus chalcogrammus]XP_056438884.1 antizyme inhibitor 1b isoform X1 [Gadus chalcogrammus]XP_056438885.1 antizyme i